jgi:hypothetical protein
VLLCVNMANPAITTLEEAGMIPGKRCNTQDKAVAFGQRPRPLLYIAGTPGRKIVSVGEWPLHRGGLDKQICF